MARPNLLFIFTDEQRYDTLAAYGNEGIETPNLNRLGAESTVFERAYVSQPVCTPSRATLLTGLYPHTNGCVENNVPLAAVTPCLPELLPRGQYATAYHGKWHLGDEIFAQHGFDEWISIDDGYHRWYSAGRDRAARSSYHQFLLESGFEPEGGDRFGRAQSARLPEGYGKPAFLAREASRFIRDNRDRPFSLFVNFFEPHMPYFGPRDDQYAPAQVVLPPNFGDLPDATQPLKARALQRAYRERGHSGLPLRTEADWRRMIANYWGLCSLVDTHVGTILDTLDECGLRDDTIVVYTSDHGDMMGSHGLLAKCVMFEEAVRVPLLVRRPGQTHGRRIAGPVSQIDLVPTLLDLMGQPVPDHLQGESLAPLLAGAEWVSDAAAASAAECPDHRRNDSGASAAARQDRGQDGPGDVAPGRRAAPGSGPTAGRGEPEASRGEGDVFIEWNGGNTGMLGEGPGGYWALEALEGGASPADLEASIADPVRTVVTVEGWKFNCSPLGEHELYDLEADPFETTNRAGDPGCAAVMRDLWGRLRRWQEETGDAVSLNSGA